MGFILLEGGSEFMGQMVLPDRRAIEKAGGPDIQVSIVPTAAAPDNNHERAGKNGTDWFESLGVTRAISLPIIDRVSADDPSNEKALLGSQLIFILGGFTTYLAQTLRGSRSWRAMMAAYRGGAVLAGSSAGAMVLCRNYYDSKSSLIREGLGLIEGVCVLPHHDTFGRHWAKPLGGLDPDLVLLGIDEQTGVLWEDGGERAQVLGRSNIAVYTRGTVEYRGPGEELNLSLLGR